MRILNVHIENFRGIKNADVKFPTDTSITCLIGAGDSTKSTILKCIELAFYPSWNISITDNDFYNCDISQNIKIAITFTEIPKNLLTEEKFGLYLQGYSAEKGILEEPYEGYIPCLTIQLSIDDTLEPIWEIIASDKENKTISYMDRRSINCAIIGENSSKDLTWSKHSILQKYDTITTEILGELTQTTRAVSCTKVEDSNKEFSSIIDDICRNFGVELKDNLSTKIVLPNGALSSYIGLCEGALPLNQRGYGTQKLLSMGLNIKNKNNNSVLLIDEVENGLEPYRLRSLINILRDKISNGMQVIMTTHSPVVLAECSNKELSMVKSVDGITNVFQLSSKTKTINNDLQALIRRDPESLLSKRLIICEGSTEVGFVKALDDYINKTYNYRMAYNGVGIANGNGSSIYQTAKFFHEKGYEICVLMDSDNKNESKKKHELIKMGIKVIACEDGKSIEEQIFSDIPKKLIDKILNVISNEKSLDFIRDKLKPDIVYKIENEQIKLKHVNTDIRNKLGKIAKGKDKKDSLFKSISCGKLVANVIFDNINQINKKKFLIKNINAIIRWINNNE